ncbi:hypothetical protein [Enterococcus sp. HY326]|uniref:hypothetical protein n=1 Tax=Enterococcus sp. HY326 TaxID=2971265 RepID=UPI0022404C1F|nr:hypothetical protein [Enterococcus sp. HY326]
MKKEASALYILFDALETVARDKIYKNFFWLYRHRYIEDDFAVIGISQDNLTQKNYSQLIQVSVSSLKPTKNELNRFLKKFYFQKISDSTGFLSLNLNAQMIEEELELNGNRIFLLPNSQVDYTPTIRSLVQFDALSKDGFNRFVVKQMSPETQTLFDSQKISVGSSNDLSSLDFTQQSQAMIQFVYAKNF